MVLAHALPDRLRGNQAQRSAASLHWQANALQNQAGKSEAFLRISTAHSRPCIFSARQLCAHLEIYLVVATYNNIQSRLSTYVAGLSNLWILLQPERSTNTMRFTALFLAGTLLGDVTANALAAPAPPSAELAVHQPVEHAERDEPTYEELWKRRGGGGGGGRGGGGGGGGGGSRGGGGSSGGGGRGGSTG